MSEATLPAAGVPRREARDASSADFDWAAALERNVPVAIAVLCLVYLVLELIYVSRLPLVMDEYQEASVLERLSSSLPYRDFSPYKSVLGHYLQWLPFRLAGGDPWLRLWAVKAAMAVVTAVGVGFAALRLSRLHRPAAVLLATSLLFFSSTFLERSAVLRVDMLTSLIGLFSLIALLERRTLVAGLLVGVSFLVSQKGVYFGIAGGASLAAVWIWSGRERDDFLAPIKFAGAALLPLVAYLALFSLLASGKSVGDSIVGRALPIGFSDLYQLRDFWFQTIFRNPFFYALGLLALGRLFARRRSAGEDARGRRDALLAAYAGVLLALCLWHKQPWPYFFVMWLPTLAVLASAFFDLELRSDGRLSHALVAATLVLGIVFPLTRVPAVLARDNGFQRHMLELADSVLEPGDTYLAGLQILPGVKQASGHMAWLDRRRLAELHAGGPEHWAVVLEQLEARNLKLVFWNYRLAELPEPISLWLRARYAPLAGNLLIYSPKLPAGESAMSLAFSGRYAVSGPPGAALQIDGRTLRPGEEIELAAGPLALRAGQSLRLHLLPDGVEERIDPRYAKPQPLFDSPYSY